MNTIFGYDQRVLDNKLSVATSMLHSIKHFAETEIHQYEEGSLANLLDKSDDYFTGEYDTYKSFYNLICNLESHLDFSIAEEYDKIIDFVNAYSEKVKER